MYFGFSNAPATFQAMMNEIFKDLIVKGKVAIYLDDILIYTNDLTEHRAIVKEVLKRLKEHDLFLKPEKCEFEKESTEYLGLVISQNKVEMDPIKVSGVSAWPAPTNKKDVQQFLGFTNFYRRFIRDFSAIARPLFDLTKKDTPWCWEHAEQNAFDTLKKQFTEAPVLLMPDKAKTFTVESDALKFATGAVLQQADINGDMHPCRYLSQSLDAAQ